MPTLPTLCITRKLHSEGFLGNLGSYVIQVVATGNSIGCGWEGEGIMVRTNGNRIFYKEDSEGSSGTNVGARWY